MTPAPFRGTGWRPARAALIAAGFLLSCTPRGDPGAPAPGIPAGWDTPECAPRSAARDDPDADGLAERCEDALAAAFAPLLVFDETDCGWDQPVCRLTPWVCRPHAGDSEIALVEVAFDPGSGRWAAERVFLSAHCHGRSDGRCRWYAGREMERFAWVDGVPRGAPVVWVARGKHGGYPSRAACDAGHWGYDSCDRNAAAARFRGWQAGVGAGATGYGRYLREVAEF